MNNLISNRRKHIFGTHQDGKALTIEQQKSFYKKLLEKSQIATQ
jgi:DNA (cytosine-5)-methyltransferase 1